MAKLKAPNADFISLLNRFGRETHSLLQPVVIRIDRSTQISVPSFLISNRRVIFIDIEAASPLEELQSLLGRTLSTSLKKDKAYEVVFVTVNGLDSDRSLVLSRGARLVPLHLGLTCLLGIPDSWIQTQHSLLERTLEPVSMSGVPKLATLAAKDDGNSIKDATALLRSLIGGWRPNPHPLCYLRSEAGKGKSTLLAFVSREVMLRGSDPLPLFIPLRILQRGRGVSWSELCASVGLVGSTTLSVLAGVRSGLVALVLDGLDEIAGRYDPTIVQQVIDVISEAARSPVSKIVISGRTTEATFLPPSSTSIFNLELPDGSDPAFTDYAELVVADITPRWPLISLRVPEPPISSLKLSNILPSEKERSTIVEWLQLLFDDLGKDRSLFFVQSLACLGRTRQLDGNKPLLIHQKPSTDFLLARPPLYDVTILAAALACIREQDKIEDLAKTVFTPPKQLELIMAYALMASTQSSIASMFPTPNEAAKFAFDLDPVNQNEEFTAVLRQMQKHALLLASGGEGIRAADWRPQFLSDWVRCAFLARALLYKGKPACSINREVIIQAIANAERARIAFQFLIPELVLAGPIKDLDHLLIALSEGVKKSSPEASANYWSLFAGLADRGPLIRVIPDESLVPLADLSGLVFDGIDFPTQFSGTLAILVNSEASGCNYRGNRFSQCDFTQAVFRGCTFVDVVFEFCDGPILFEDCIIRNCKFVDAHGHNLPAYIFEGCRFEGGNLIQQSQIIGGGLFGPIATFLSCVCVERPRDLLVGDFIGYPILPPPGLVLETEAPIVPPEVSCLRALLGPFFPRRAGSQGELQSRGYIRESAVGRGLFPEGTPVSNVLEETLFAFGFTDGGRPGHIYAPWSPVVGGGQDSVEFRNELIAFLVRGVQGPSVRQMLTRIRESGYWSR